MADDPARTCGEVIGYVKWFSNARGYGFLTVQSPGALRGRDLFVHHAGLRPLNSRYRTLQRGEYVSFDLEDSGERVSAVNVTGVLGGPMMCDHARQAPAHVAQEGHAAPEARAASE